MVCEIGFESRSANSVLKLSRPERTIAFPPIKTEMHQDA